MEGSRTGLPDIWLAAPFALGYPPGQAFHLLKDLHGFQHSPRAFYDAFSNFLLEQLKFIRCVYDKTLFYRKASVGTTYLSLYVDDAHVVCSDDATWDELNKEVAIKYELSSVGDATLHLGLTINYDRKRGILALGNSNYVEQMATRFQIPLDVTVTALTPFSRPRTQLYPASVTNEAHVGSRKQQAYRAGVGSLNWLAQTNRPDLAFAVSQLARHLATPTRPHVAALVRTLKYTMCTRAFALRYNRDPVINPAIRTAEVSTFVGRNQLVGFCDADFANDIATRKSHTGFAFLLNHGAIDWKSSQQRLVASSSTESEYLALSYCVKQTQYLRHILTFLDQHQSGRQRSVYLPLQQ